MSTGVGFRITKLWAYLAVHADGDEGIIAVLNPQTGTWTPAIGADETRVRLLRPKVEEIARDQGMRVQLCRFDVRVDLETIDPARHRRV